MPGKTTLLRQLFSKAQYVLLEDPDIQGRIRSDPRTFLEQVLATWRSFDEFLERKFPEARRKAYYLMAIHEQPPCIHKVEMQQVGEGDGISEGREEGWSEVRLCNLVAQSHHD